MMCFLKRVLPFALTLVIGLTLGSLFRKAPRVVQTHDGVGVGIGSGSGGPTNRGVDSGRLFTPREVDQKARILSRPEPKYTDDAREHQVQGTVVLQAVFAEDGMVKNIRVVSGLPDGLTERAVAAAREIKFSPALKDGRAVSQYIQIEYNYNLY
jgi:protein TonB